MNWGGSGIEKVVYDFICNNIIGGSTIIELGAGHVSTNVLSGPYKLFSVEHNKEFVGIYPAANYIHAPLVNGWYDVEILKSSLPPKEEQKLIFIDGINRRGILNHLDLFNPHAMYLIHDLWREYEKTLTVDLSMALNRPYKIYDQGDHWSVI